MQALLLLLLAPVAAHLRGEPEAAPEDALAKEMTHDLEMNFNKIAPFGHELGSSARIQTAPCVAHVYIYYFIDV